jgi:hypothetical protein
MQTSPLTSSRASAPSSRHRQGRRPAGLTGLAGLAGLAGLLLVGGLSGCTSGGDDSATDPAATSSPSSPSETPSESPAETSSESPGETPADESSDDAPAVLRAVGSAGITEVLLLDATEGGGSPSTLATALDTDLAVDDFVVGLQAGLPGEVAATVADLAQQSPDATPYGAVVSTGCEPPRSVAIEAGEAGFEVVPALPKSTVQCLAPVTYVVLFAAPNA